MTVKVTLKIASACGHGNFCLLADRDGQRQRRRCSDGCYSIGYAELTYAVRDRLSYGIVANRTGQYIKANLASVTAAAAGVADQLPDDFRLSITDPPSDNAYPISSFTWMLVPSVISDSRRRKAVVAFLQWGLTKGQDLLSAIAITIPAAGWDKRHHLQL
jgi:ABC-type phosphate transport system substrate-binding protein